LFIDPAEQFQIPQNPVRFCEHGHTTSILFDKLQTFSCYPKLFFTVHIRIAHSTCSDHTLFPLGTQPLLQQCRCILLYLDIFKRMGESITFASAVAVNTPMGTTPVNIHSVAG